MLDAQIPSGQGGGVVLIQDGTDQSSVFFFLEIKMTSSMPGKER